MHKLAELMWAVVFSYRLIIYRHSQCYARWSAHWGPMVEPDLCEIHWLDMK